MSFLRKLFGIAPTLLEDGAFTPSQLALKLATSSKTDFDGGVYPKPYRGGNKRVLMVCTERRYMTMANGKRFSTGNHPVEMGLPMLHLLAAGFEIDIVTPTGKPVVVEDWAMPREDVNVMRLYQDFAKSFEKPGSLVDFARNSLIDDTSYIAVFLPGGHGAMLGLPESEDLGKVLRWAHDRALYTLAICHGPAALLAANPARRFGLGSRKGRLAAGFDADFCLLAPEESVIERKDLLSRHPISPYVGMKSGWRVAATWLRGNPVSPATHGRFLSPE